MGDEVMIANMGAQWDNKAISRRLREWEKE